MFTVVCKDCQRVLMTVERLRDPEIATLEGHIRACSHAEPLGETPMLGKLHSHVRVMRIVGVKDLAAPPE